MQRKKSQINGLIEPYTVMVQGRPTVVEAASPEEAAELAQPTEEVEQEDELIAEKHDGE